MRSDAVFSEILGLTVLFYRLHSNLTTKPIYIVADVAFIRRLIGCFLNRCRIPSEDSSATIRTLLEAFWTRFWSEFFLKIAWSRAIMLHVAKREVSVAEQRTAGRTWKVLTWWGNEAANWTIIVRPDDSGAAATERDWNNSTACIYFWRHI